jgi:hypothetical protein
MRSPAVRSLVVLLLAGACAPAPAWQGNIEERDGVVYVDNPAEGLWNDATRPPFRLELEQVFGVEDEPVDAILASVLGGKSFALDGDGNVYVLDRSANQIVAFAPDGTVMWRAGRQGEGPGEIQMANGIVWDGEDRLYASLQNGGNVDIWDLDGNHVERQRLADLGFSTAYVVGMLDPTTLVLWDWGRDRDGVTVYVLAVGDPWRMQAEFFVNGGFEDDPGRMDGTNIEVATGGGRIRTGHRIEYLLRAFDAQGNLTRVIWRDVPPLVPTLTHGGTGWNFGEFLAPLQLADGRFLVPRKRMPNVGSAEQFIAAGERAETPADLGDLMEWESAVDLLDPEGRYVGSVEMPGLFEATGTLALVGPDGRLYTRTQDPFPQVRRYRVEILEEGAE